MWPRLGYATASGILGILAAAAIMFAGVLANRCGPENALSAVVLSAIVAFPLTAIIGGFAGVLGYQLQRRSVLALGAILALALGIAGVEQAVPHHDDPNLIQCIRIDL
jgi:hypothetical protein